MVKGCTLEFATYPHHTCQPKEIKFSSRECLAIKIELQRLLDKGIIIPSEHETCEFISTIFVRPKADGSFRLILNLKRLNEHIVYHHFKMESLKSVIQLMEKDCFMASVDLRDAYYSIPMSVHAQKYLKFTWGGKLYQFTCLPNGLCCAPRLFTKLLKPVYSTLRLKGHLSVGYIDDSYLQGNTFVACQENVTDTVNIFQDLGFTIHPEKSILVPTRKLTFLGFILDSHFMRISLTAGKADSLKAAAQALLLRKSPTIREVAEVIGKMVASFPGVQLGPLYYRQLENDKIKALRENYGNFDRPMVISGTARADLKWWINNIQTSYKPIRVAPPVMELKSDASHLGWGAVHGDRSTGGRWTDKEKLQHINVLELQAVFFALKVFCKEITNAHVKVFSDNTTTVTYINNMGGSHSLHCNALTRDMWLWCIDKGIWLSAAHLPGSQNIQADRASRIFHDQTEWKLDQDIFHRITSQLIKPEVDLFASRLNFQLDRYVSWKPDPGALAVDAFTLDWSSYVFYAFPPFSVLGRVVQKIQEDMAEGILLIPNWPTQPWFPKVMRLLVKEPLLLPKNNQLLQLPYNKTAVHPLVGKLTLLACLLSGNPCRAREFRRTLSTSLCHPGGNQRSVSMEHICRSGRISVVDGVLIQFHQL